jgi:hypothetical protein
MVVAAALSVEYLEFEGGGNGYEGRRMGSRGRYRWHRLGLGHVYRRCLLKEPLQGANKLFQL